MLKKLTSGFFFHLFDKIVPVRIQIRIQVANLLQIYLIRIQIRNTAYKKALTSCMQKKDTERLCEYTHCSLAGICVR
jgi:hypothetical protein